MEVGRKLPGRWLYIIHSQPWHRPNWRYVGFPASSWAYCVLLCGGVFSVVLTRSLEEGVKAGKYLVAAGEVNKLSGA